MTHPAGELFGCNKIAAGGIYAAPTSQPIKSASQQNRGRGIPRPYGAARFLPPLKLRAVFPGAEVVALQFGKQLVVVLQKQLAAVLLKALALVFC